MRHFLDFEKPIAELQGRIDELRESAGGVDIGPEVAKLQTALREAGESSGRYEAAVEANRNAKAVLLDAMKAITATQGDSKDADPTRIAMELPILEGTQTQRQQLQGELRQLDSAIATLHKRLKELKDLQD